jgi:hypothetical protein
MDCFIPDSAVPNPLLSSAAYRPSGLNAIVSGKPFVRCGVPGVGLITVLLVGSRVRSCSWLATGWTKKVGQRRRKIALIPTDKQPPASRDANGWSNLIALTLNRGFRRSTSYKATTIKSQPRIVRQSAFIEASRFFSARGSEQGPRPLREFVCCPDSEAESAYAASRILFAAQSTSEGVARPLREFCF